VDNDQRPRGRHRRDSAPKERAANRTLNHRGVAITAGTRMVARLLGSAMQAVTLVLLARSAPVAEFGGFMVAFGLSMVVGIVIGFGAPARALRAPADPHYRTLLSSLFWLHSLFVAIGLAAGVLACLAFGSGAAIFAGLLFGASDTINNYCQSHLAGDAHQGTASLLVLVQRALPALLIGLLSAHGQFDFTAMTACFAITAVIALVAVVPSAREGPRLSVALRGSFHYWTYTLTATLPQLELPGLGFVAGGTTVGPYSIASRVVGPITIFSASAAQVVIPELAKRVGTPAFDSLYRRFLQVGLSFSALVVLCAQLIADAVLAVVGDNYAHARTLIFAMVVASAVTVCSQVLNCKLIALGHASHATWAIGGGGILSIGLLLAIGASGHDELLWVAPITTQVVVFMLLAAAVHRVGKPSPSRHSRKVG
jgi:O-antigen/teichoic acid export membrane protein